MQNRILAQLGGESVQKIGEGSGLHAVSPEKITSSIISIVLSLVGIILVLYIIYAGYLWMTAGGDSDKVDTAKTIIRNCVIGLVITMSAYAISFFVVEQLFKVV